MWADTLKPVVYLLEEIWKDVSFKLFNEVILLKPPWGSQGERRQQGQLKWTLRRPYYVLQTMRSRKLVKRFVSTPPFPHRFRNPHQNVRKRWYPIQPSHSNPHTYEWLQRLKTHYSVHRTWNSRTNISCENWKLLQANTLSIHWNVLTTKNVNVEVYTV